MLEQNNKQTSKRRVPAVTKIALAAALAVGCVLSIAAGLPAQVYNFVSGGSVTLVPGTGEGSFVIGDVTDPVEVRDGRLWFTADGQKLDITDLVDENTPYIYEHTDPATGKTGYVVVGGTVDDYGWAEFFMTEGGDSSMTGHNFFSSRVTLPDGSVASLSDLTDEQLAQVTQEDGGIMLDNIHRPWLDAALDQLSLDT